MKRDWIGIHRHGAGWRAVVSRGRGDRALNSTLPEGHIPIGVSAERGVRLTCDAIETVTAPSFELAGALDRLLRSQE